MALRQIDNALQTLSPDHRRPKKLPKPAAMPLNDENAPPSATETVIIDYIVSQDLLPLPDPDVKFLGLVEGLESTDWIRICESLNDVRRFAIHHSVVLLPILEKVMVVIVKAMKNPRSALCKTSIMAASDVFSAYGDSLLLEKTITAENFDQLLLQLLLKASQDKKFVCEEADRALKLMVESMTPLPLLHKLHKYITHANPRIRAKAAVSVSNCISKMVAYRNTFFRIFNLIFRVSYSLDCRLMLCVFIQELDGAKEFGLVPLVQTALKLLNDRLPEAREAARSTLVSIYQKFTENEGLKLESWQTFCEANLSAIQALEAIKVAPS